AMSAPASFAYFESVDLDDFDSGRAILGIAVNVLGVRHDHTGFDGDDVVAAVPLLALLLRFITAGSHDLQLVLPETKRIGDRTEEAFLRHDIERPRIGAGADAVRFHRF